MTAPPRVVAAAGLLLLVACSVPPELTTGRTEQALGSAHVAVTLNTTDASYPDLAPQAFTQVAGTTFFVGTGLGAGSELWATDGTAAGTRLVRDISAGPLASTPMWLTPFNGRLLFVGNEPSTGLEIWSSDGTLAGTVLPRDATKGPPSTFQTPFSNGGTGGGVGLTPYAGSVYFPGTGGLWKTDGTAANTALALPGLNWVPDFNASVMTVFNGELYGSANDSTHGFELWAYNAADAGARLVADIWSAHAGRWTA